MFSNKDLIIKILLVFLASITNFWIYWLYEYNFILGELLIIETLLLFLSTLPKKNIFLPFLVFVILAILSIFLLISNLDTNLFSVSTDDSIRIENRRNYFAQELGKIYKNRVGIFYFDYLRLYLDKIQSNLFSALDWSLYFSPAKLIDNEKYPLLLAPFFILGLLYLIKNAHKTVIICFFISLVVNTLTNLDSKFEPVLLFPFISLCIGLGFIQITKGVRKRLSMYKI